MQVAFAVGRSNVGGPPPDRQTGRRGGRFLDCLGEGDRAGEIGTTHDARTSALSSSRSVPTRVKVATLCP